MPARCSAALFDHQVNELVLCINKLAYFANTGLKPRDEGVFDPIIDECRLLSLMHLRIK